MRHAISPKPMVSASIHHSVSTLMFCSSPDFLLRFYLFSHRGTYLVVRGIYDATQLGGRRWHSVSVYKSEKFAKCKTIGFGIISSSVSHFVYTKFWLSHNYTSSTWSAGQPNNQRGVLLFTHICNSFRDINLQ